ncbi:hypothetical protein SAMN05216420_104144 [Nitrosospira sp. Nl5]|uniref:hypothetical protein n=1 Tax=Nitrosospira sp. Nl5 TaxID=200120 RepID=UPI00088F6CD5|nr:hypothetical protein [Nitrosospira sp. Nl5]SCY29462.1 hypothetical protein SAMN05216420_104144 [Nitrosospira sp. Nl5]
MKSVKTVLAVISSAAIFIIAPAAIAEESPGLMNVNISNVAKDIAKNINVDVSQIPKTVQIRVGLAAQVCNVAADVLADRHRSGVGSCTAEITTAELDQTVLGQVKGITR